MPTRNFKPVSSMVHPVDRLLARRGPLHVPRIAYRLVWYTPLGRSRSDVWIADRRSRINDLAMVWYAPALAIRSPLLQFVDRFTTDP